ncbi:MAG: lmo0937 family membrane protein [Syntrophales bacterium]
MLWTIALVLIIFWMLGLVAGYTTGFFIHGLYAIAVVLLLVSINREVNIYRELNHMVRKRN